MGDEHVSLSSCAQEVNFAIILLEKIYEVQKPAIFHEDNQGYIFLTKNRYADIFNKSIDIHLHFLRDMV